MYKLPIKSPNKPFLTQKYGETANNQWYLDHGIKNAFHNGTDWVTGTNVQTYGTPLVCPFPEGGKVTQIVFDNLMSTKGNGVYVESTPINGVSYRIILWHTGEIAVKYGQQLKEGDVICYIGNSGLCNPPPTTDNPYAGSHLHFGCYKLDHGNYVYTPPTVLGETDPLLYFDKDQWYLGEDSGASHDLAPLTWMWSKLNITDWWMKLLTAFRFWGK